MVAPDIRTGPLALKAGPGLHENDPPLDLSSHSPPVTDMRSPANDTSCLLSMLAAPRLNCPVICASSKLTQPLAWK